jgi:hypothetical protein
MRRCVERRKQRDGRDAGQPLQHAKISSLWVSLSRYGAMVFSVIDVSHRSFSRYVFSHK